MLDKRTEAITLSFIVKLGILHNYFIKQTLCLLYIKGTSLKCFD